MPGCPDARLASEQPSHFYVTTRYENTLDGRSRGIELMVQRRSPNRLYSGSLQISLSPKYRRNRSSETFDADYDQRRTVNMSRLPLGDRLSFGAHFRAAANFPVPGSEARTFRPTALSCLPQRHAK